MNKTFITVGIIFTVLATLMLLLFGTIFINSSDIVYELALQDPDIILVAQVLISLLSSIVFLLLYLTFLILLINASDIVYELALQDPDINLVAQELISLFSTVAVFMFIFAFLNIIAAVRIFMLRNSQTSSKEALGWAIYLLFGAGLLGGIFSRSEEHTSELQ